MFSANIPFNVFAEEITNDTTITEDELVSGSALAVSDSSIDVEFNITGQWEGGFNGEIKITNLTDVVIENWQIQMEFPQEITNIWNAAIESHEGTVYNIRNAGNNNNVNIPVGESVTFGFSGTYEDSITSPSNVKLVQSRADVDEEAYTIEYSLLSDWGSGYSAQITITNNTDKPFEAWHLSFDFDRNIDSIWNAVIEEHTDNKYYISNADYNSVIPANQSISIGFNGTDGFSDDIPYDYKLTHIGDTSVLNNHNNDYSISIIYAKNDYAESVTEDIILPNQDDDKIIDILWESSDTSIISNNGKVTRPYGKSKYVTLTAKYLNEDGQYEYIYFNVKVVKAFINTNLPNCTLDSLEQYNNGAMPFIWIDETTSKIKYIDGNYTNYNVESPSEAIYSLNALKDLYGIKNPEDEYVFYDYSKVENVNIYRLQQVYNGIPLWLSYLIITTDDNGKITSINGTYEDVENISVTPQSSFDDLNKIFNNGLVNNLTDFYIYDKEGEFVLCWKVYDTYTERFYLVEDNSLLILGAISNNSNAFYQGKSYTAYATPTQEHLDDLKDCESKIYNVAPYVEIDGNGRTYLQGYYKSNEPITKTDGDITINFAKARYSSNIIGYELYDKDSNIMCLYREDDNSKLHTIGFEETSKSYYQDSINAMKNSIKALKFYQGLGIKNVLEISGNYEQTGVKNRPLYVVVQDSLIDGETTGRYSKDNQALFLSTSDVNATKCYDCIVHEMTHGILYNKIGFYYLEELNPYWGTSNDFVLKQEYPFESRGYSYIIHEAYGDIMGCLANGSWIFMYGKRNISNPTGNYLKELPVEDEKKLPMTSHVPDIYYYSTILSHAAYRMNVPENKNDKVIMNSKLAEIWYLSMLDLDVKNISFDEVANCVYRSARKLGCSPSELTTIRNAFASAGINFPTYGVYGDVTNNDNTIPASFTISSNTTNNSIISNYKYYMTLFPKEFNSDITLECVALNKKLDYSFSYDMFDDNSVLRKDFVFDVDEKSYCDVYGQLYDWNSLKNFMEGITIELINNDSVFFTKSSNGNLYYFNHIPEGIYTLIATDDRELMYESNRCKTVIGTIIVSKDQVNKYDVYFAPLYDIKQIYVYWDTEDGEIPFENVELVIKNNSDDSIWYITTTDENGYAYVPYENDKLYDVYENDIYIDSY